MTYCPQCGAAANGPFCASCGREIAGGRTAGTAPDPAAAPLADNLASALCYLLLGVTGLLFLVLEPYNRKRSIRFHAFQSIFLTVALILAWMVLLTVAVVIAAIPLVGLIIVWLLSTGLSILALIAWLVSMYKAYNNERFVLPVIGPLAEKQS